MQGSKRNSRVEVRERSPIAGKESRSPEVQTCFEADLASEAKHDRRGVRHKLKRGAIPAPHGLRLERAGVAPIWRTGLTA